MSRVPESDRVKVWLGRLNRFSSSQLTVKQFCVSENCSVGSLYKWKRRLTPTIPPPAPRSSKVNGKANAAKKFSSPSFAELTMTTRSPSVLVRLPKGGEIRLGSEAKPARQIVAEIVLQCCGPRAQRPRHVNLRWKHQDISLRPCDGHAKRIHWPFGYHSRRI